MNIRKHTLHNIQVKLSENSVEIWGMQKIIELSHYLETLSSLLHSNLTPNSHISLARSLKHKFPTLTFMVPLKALPEAPRCVPILRALCWAPVQNPLALHKSDTLRFSASTELLKSFAAFVHFWCLKQTRADNFHCLSNTAAEQHKEPGPAPLTHTGNQNSLLMPTFSEQDFIGSSEGISQFCFRAEKAECRLFQKGEI